MDAQLRSVGTVTSYILVSGTTITKGRLAQLVRALY